MAATGTVDITSTIQGLTQEGGPIGPVDLSLQLGAQAYAFEMKDYRIPVSATLPGTPSTVNVPPVPAGQRQSLFLIKSDQPIEFSLNGGVVIERLERADRFWLVMSSVSITQIDFGNLSGVEARVYVLQIVEPTT